MWSDWWWCLMGSTALLYLRAKTTEVRQWKQGEQWGPQPGETWWWLGPEHVKVQMVKGVQILDWLINLAINYHHLKFKVNLLIENICFDEGNFKISYKPKHKATLQISNPLFSWWQIPQDIFFIFWLHGLWHLGSWQKLNPGHSSEMEESTESTGPQGVPSKAFKASLNI